MPKIFLSPSTQEWNSYVNGGNEQLYMNYLADRIEPYLRSSGIDFVRNDPAKNVVGAIADSNKGDYDLHLALHSNAAGGDYAGKIRGVDIYYSPTSEPSEDLATIMANNFKEIYPLSDKSRAVPTTSLGEVTQTNAVSILAEIGYHDNVEDEAWLKANLTPIAKNIVLSLTDYFGIPFIPAGAVRSGVVNAGGSNLNLRSYPSASGKIIGSIPNGANVTVYGEYNGWYVVRYGGKTGYANANFIDV
ncbi:MAG: N-acetylmuramoyl-L-alanine amidase [Oscillospiraceae bacterium]